MKKKKHTCLVCGFDSLSESPRSKGGGGSYEICPACGFQFGVDDDDRGIRYEDWRAKWLAAGGKWSSKGIPRPKGWKPPAKTAKAKPSAKKRARK